MALTAYADVDHAGCQDTRRSTSGSAQFLKDKLVSWSSKKKKSTTISTTEAEYIAMSGCYKMAEENVLAPAPISSDDQILPFAVWVPIEKSNHNTLTYVKKAGTYQFQLDENWFTLDTDLLREALEITPIDQAHLFVSPPSGDAIMDFVNEQRYPEAHISSSSDALGIITSTNVDYAELMWEEFVQAIQTFLTDKANLGSPTKKGRRDKPYVISYCRFTKLIICHLGRIHNIHQRSASPFHLAEEDLRLGNLKFVSKGEIDEVFGMPIPNEEGKKKYVSTKQPKPKHVIEKSSKPAPAPKPNVTKVKPSKASTAKPPKPKLAKEMLTNATLLPKAGKGKVVKVCNVKSSFQLVNEHDEEPAHSEPEPEPKQEGAGEEYDIEQPVAKAIQPLPIVEGKGKAIVNEEQAAQSLLA
ncbi:retrovirus-related pol polyprotein from transposon TNT 1-94 [Tanacetum coccineum]|uniref:Retrovirus-related pol polyprotein from transposon TNT 1-94 n=1 Tax=Tanacetum coccineum TaxID=301880 RepID=A0ABQ5DM12_9ASTR